MSEPDDWAVQPGLTPEPAGGREQDKRSEYRLSGRASVLLELEAADPDDGDHGQPRTLTAQTHDLSATGMRIITAEPVTLGAILPIQVQLAGDDARYQLIAEVVWCERRSSAHYAVGLNVLDSDGSSFVDWMDAVARAMVQD